MKKTRTALSDTFTKLTQIWKSFSDKDYRDAAIRANIMSGVAGQIFSMRERAGLTQSGLAQKCGMKQTRISLLESGESENLTIDTLARIASAFDVALAVRYVPFSDLAEWSADMNQAKLAPANFATDEIESRKISIEHNWGFSETSTVASDQRFFTDFASEQSKSLSIFLVSVGRHRLPFIGKIPSDGATIGAMRDNIPAFESSVAFPVLSRVADHGALPTSYRAMN